MDELGDTGNRHRRATLADQAGRRCRLGRRVEEALGLNSGALTASRGVLSQHGTLSGATILFILDRLLREEPSLRGAGVWPRPHRRTGRF